MAMDNGAKESNVMQANGKLTKNDLGRGNQDAKNSAGNSKLRTPSGTSDFRDPVDTNAPIHVMRLTSAAKPGKGGHDKSLLGG